MPDMGILQQAIVRTERGLSIAETRITLYDVMGYLHAGWPPALIQNWLNLTDAQLADAMSYIAEHREEVEAEYQTVLQHAQENRAYWEARNRDRLRRIDKGSASPEQKAIRAKIQAHKAKLGLR
jgi:uncharacterized protein (DUF433 family)